MGKKRVYAKPIELMASKEEDDFIEESLETRGKMVSGINTNIAERADIRILPSIHTIVSNSYVTIANEIQRLSLRSGNSPLSSSEVRTFERLTSALARLVSVEQDIKEESGGLAGISDADLLAAADAARQKLLSKKGQR